MEDSNKRSQIRALEESSGFLDRELEYLYDTFKRAKFKNDSIENRLVGYLSFRQILFMIPVWNFNHPNHFATTTATVPSSGLPSTVLQSFASSLSPALQLAPSSTTLKEKTLTSGGADRVMLTPDSSVVDRIYGYCFNKTKGSIDFDTVVSVLSTICKGTATEKLQFFFEIHDVDGDGILNKAELTGVMDSLLWLFEDVPNDEEYFRAISAFIQSAYKATSTTAAPTASAVGVQTQGVADTESVPAEAVATPSSPHLAAGSSSSSSVSLTLNQFKLSILAQPPLMQFFSKNISLAPGEE